MEIIVVVFKQLGYIEFDWFVLIFLIVGDVVVDVDWSGVSIGIEWLLWLGWMFVFFGMGYFFVFGYELVGCVVEVGMMSGFQVG